MPDPDAERARRKYARLARRYDVSLAVLQPWLSRYRRRAVDSLELRPGETVLDVGAGTGASLELLAAGVGPEGRVVAIEPSEAMLDAARRRVDAAGLRNVEFRHTTAQDAAGLPTADAALFFLTHDIVRSRDAVERVFGSLRPGARVATFGAKEGGPPPVRAVMRRFTARFVTTLEGLDAPWEYLTPRLEDVQIRSLGFDQAYLATGRVVGRAPAGT